VLLVFACALRVSYATSFGVVSHARQISFGPRDNSFLFYLSFSNVQEPTSFGVLSPARRISFEPWVLFGPAFLFYLSFSNVQEHPLAHKQHDVFSAYVLRHQ
jgi:hypothetical protein